MPATGNEPRFAPGGFTIVRWFFAPPTWRSQRKHTARAMTLAQYAEARKDGAECIYIDDKDIIRAAKRMFKKVRRQARKRYGRCLPRPLRTDLTEAPSRARTQLVWEIVE